MSNLGNYCNCSLIGNVKRNMGYPVRSSVFLIMLLFTSPAHAARIYELVNYPDLQNGHTLTGTITTTDNAPDDGLLALEEILDWQWSVSGANSFLAQKSDFFSEESGTTGVSISDRSISINLQTSNRAMLRLNRSDISGDFPQEINGHDLTWIKDDPAQTVTGTRYGAWSSQGGELTDFWLGVGLSDKNSIWEIAIAIPEPTTTALIIPVALATLALRREI